MPSSALAISRMNQKPRELNQGVSQTTELFWTVDGTVPVVCALPVSELTGTAGATTGVASRFTLRAYGRVFAGATASFGIQIYYTTNTLTSASVNWAAGADQNPITTSSVSVTSGVATQWYVELAGLYNGDQQRIEWVNSNAMIGTTTNVIGTNPTATTSVNPGLAVGLV